VRAPYRFANPPELPRTEEADSYEAKLHRDRQRYLQWFVLGGLTFATFTTIAAASASRTISPPPPANTPGDAIAHARTVVIDARGEVNLERFRFGGEEAAAMQGKREADEPATACPITLPEPSRMIRGQAPFDLVVVMKDGPEQPAPAIERQIRDVQTAESYLDGPYPSHALPYSRAFETMPVGARLAQTQQVLFVASTWQRPTRSSVQNYEAGAVEGTAYLYDFRAHRIVCAGPIKASSSRSLAYTFNDGKAVPAKEAEQQGVRLDQMLDDDLDSQLANAIAAPGALSVVTKHH
jgi:hypothetical protein